MSFYVVSYNLESQNEGLVDVKKDLYQKRSKGKNIPIVNKNVIGSCGT